MSWMMAILGLGAVGLAFVVIWWRAKVSTDAEATADRRADDAADLKKLTSQALHSRPPRRADEQW